MRRMPHYFRDFHCTGTACRDNCCCVGWEIEIDPDTAQAYRSMGGALGDRLRAALYEEDGCTCMGQVDGKCPFLDPQNLCSIQQTLGADMLGEICREHPRYYAWFHGLTEAGVGMCCEEAARLILSDPAPDTFLTEESREDNDCDYDPAVFDALFAARETAFHLLQNRSMPLAERLALFLVFADGLQEDLDLTEPERIYQDIRRFSDTAYCKALLNTLSVRSRQDPDHAAHWRALLELITGLDILDTAWKQGLEQLAEQPEVLFCKGHAFRETAAPFAYAFEHGAVYHTYRYFLKAVFDGDLVAKAQLTVIATLILGACCMAEWTQSGTLSLEQIIRQAKIFSQEVEYSMENLDTLAEASYRTDVFHTQGFVSMLLGQSNA